MGLTLAALVTRAVRAGAEELRLVPNRPAVHARGGITTDMGEPCPQSVIDELIEPLLSPEARMDLALGCAEWGAEIDEVGAVLVRAELRGDETHVTFLLDGFVGASARPFRISSVAPADLELVDDEHPELTDFDIVHPNAGASYEPVELTLGAPGALSVSMPPALGITAVAAPGSSPRAAPPPPPSLPVELSARPPAQGAVRVTGPKAGQGPALEAQKRPVPPDRAVQGAVAPAPPAAVVSAVPVPPAAVVSAVPVPVPAPAAAPVPAAAPAPAAASPAGAPAAASPAGAPAAASSATAAPSRARELHQLLMATLQARGSDLHLSSGVAPMVRIDGDMRPVSGRGALTPALIEQMVWPLVPERSRADFLRKRDADFAIDIEGHARFRANIFVDRNGIGAVFRVIPTQIVPAERLGLPPEVLRLCQLPKGLVLVTGPTGSGKSTTLASLIDYVNRTRSGHIVTIEDPIEFVFENKKCLVNQREVGTHTNSFRDALRAALREDPDVVLVGEMRDLETIEIALETAETGHLVFATLHTTSAPATVDRIIDQFPADRQNQIRIMLAESLKGVIAQMLCRRTGGGRVAAFEVLFGIPAVAHLIRERKVFQITTVMQTGAKVGMRVMNDSLLDLVKRGLVTADEALSKTQDRSSLLTALRDGKPEAG